MSAAVAPVDLLAQIIELVKSYPDGMKIGDMESSLNASKSQINAAVKKLHKNGRLKKNGGKFYSSLN